MSNRHLALAAAIVWAIAVLVGVFIAAPLWFGFEVDAGLIANALVALGTFAAAAAAVWVATSDRRERARARDAEDEAQAKLVVVTAQCQERPLELQVRVVNYGTRAIVDVTLVKLVVQGHEDLKLWPTTGPLPPIPTPGGGQSLFAFNPEVYGKRHPYFVAIRGDGSGQPRSITPNTSVTATMRWTDASGKLWERWGSGPWILAAAGLAVNIRLGTPVRIGP